MESREKAKDLFRKHLKKHETHIYALKPIHCVSAIDAIEEALTIPDVNGRREQLFCDCKNCKPFPNHAAGIRKNKICIKGKAN